MLCSPNAKYWFYEIPKKWHFCSDSDNSVFYSYKRHLCHPVKWKRMVEDISLPSLNLHCKSELVWRWSGLLSNQNLPWPRFSRGKLCTHTVFWILIWWQWGKKEKHGLWFQKYGHRFKLIQPQETHDMACGKHPALWSHNFIFRGSDF